MNVDRYNFASTIGRVIFSQSLRYQQEEILRLQNIFAVAQITELLISAFKPKIMHRVV